MDTLEARHIVLKEQACLRVELSNCKCPSSKRTILQNLQACEDMLLYLDLIERGYRVKFKVTQDYEPIFIKQEIVLA